MERILIKPGVYKKVNKRKSPDNSMKRRIKNAQEKNDLQREIKPPQKYRFYNDNDLRPRLRKSMLVRDFEDAEKNLICSTPHHTNDKNNGEFIRKNFSVLLSPITFNRLSTEKQKSVNEQKNEKNAGDESSEIRSNNNKNYTLSENAQDQQEIRKSLRISRRSQSMNKSKIDNRSINIVNHDPKNSDTSFKSHERSRAKIGKSPGKILAKSPVKSPQVQEVAVKKTRIPVRTASQEKAKPLESNNNILVTENQLTNQDHENKCVTPRTTAIETRSFSKNQSLSKKLVTEDIVVDAQPMGGCKDISLKSPQKSSNQVGKAPSALSPSNTNNHDQVDDEDVIVISSTCLTNSEGSTGEDVEQKRNSITPRSDNQPDRPTETSNDKLDRNSNEFVNKTPRRRNNGTLPSQDQQSAICNTANIPMVAIMTPSQCENPDGVQNKSRPSAVRCNKGDKSEIVSRTAYLGITKLGEPEILQNTPLQKSVGIQLSPHELLDSTLKHINADTVKKISPNPIRNLVAEITARKSALNGEMQSPVSTGQNNKCVATPEVGNTNPLSNILGQHPAKESYRSQECQTSINRRRRGSGRKEKFYHFEEFRCLAPVAAIPILGAPTPNRSNVISFGCGPSGSDTNSSSGHGSNLCEAAFNYVEDNRQSRFQIFESLEEDNIVDDALNFSDSDYDEHFNLFEEEESKRPWRFSSDDVPELPPTFRRPRDFSCDNNDSATLCPRKKSLLRPRESTAGLFAEGLQRDADTLIKTGRKKYAKKGLKPVEEPVSPLIQTVSSPTTEIFTNGHASLRASSNDNNDFASLGPRNKTVLRPHDPTAILNKSGKKKYNNKRTKLVEEPINPLNQAASSPTTPRMSNNESSSLGASHNEAPRESSHQQSEAVSAKSSAKGRLTSTNNEEYNERSPKPIEEPLHQANDAVSLLTTDRASDAVMPSSENSSLEVASPKHSESIPKRHAEESCVSKALKKSRKNIKNVPVANDTLTSCENLILSISSADQQLLGIRPLSQIASNRAEGTGRIGADSAKSSKKVNEGQKSNSGQESLQEIPNMDSGTGNQENTIQRVVESDTDMISPQRNKNSKKRVTKSDTKKLSAHCNINERNILPVIEGGRPQRTRNPVRLLSDMVIDESILLEWGKKKGLVRSGSKKKSIGESIKKSKETKPRTRKGKSKILPNTNLEEIPENVQTELVVPENSQNPASNKSSQNFENNGDSIAGKKKDSEPVLTDGKRPRRGRSQNKANTTKTTTQTRTKTGDQNEVVEMTESSREEDRVPLESGLAENNGDSIAGRKKDSEPVLTDGKGPGRGRSQNKRNTTKTTTQTRTKAGDQSEVVEMPESSRVEDRVPLERDLVENLPLPHVQVSEPIDNESMPPPKRNTINSTRKRRTNRELTIDSGIDTTNTNNTNKNVRNLSNNRARGTSKKTKSTNRGDANVEASQEFSLPNQPENDTFPNPVSTTEQSPRHSGFEDGTRKKQKLANDGSEDTSTSALTMSGTSRYLERSVMSDRTPDLTQVDVVNNNDYLSYMKDNKLYSIKMGNKKPLDTDYKRFGNFEVTQTTKFKDNFSAGHIRMHAGNHKGQNIATKYSLMYSVLSGSAYVQGNNKTCTVDQGGYFVIPVGTEYSIKNLDPQKELVMSYIKIKCP